VRHCVQAAFNGRRIMVFSGGAAKGEDSVYDDARAIRDGGGNGSIIGRNTFQRSREDAMTMLNRLVEIYKGRD
jgi:class I fructose-bisphosphate aldolase